MDTRTRQQRFSPADAHSFVPVSPGEAAGRVEFSHRGRAVAVKRAGLFVLVAAAGAALLLVAAGWYLLQSVPASDRINPEAYGRVGAGMTRQEVEAAVGLPPGDYRGRAHRPGGAAYAEWSEEAAGEEFSAEATAGRLHWEGEEYSIVAGFDEGGAVAWKTLWRHVPPPPRGPLDELRARVRW
jgi:hypothetical protein